MNLRMNDVEKRKVAMDWWNMLDPLIKNQLCDLNTDKVGQNRHYSTLTGREIQNIYFNTLPETYSREDLHTIANWMWRECGEPEGFSRDRVHDYIEKHLKK